MACLEHLTISELLVASGSNPDADQEVDVEKVFVGHGAHRLDHRGPAVRVEVLTVPDSRRRGSRRGTRSTTDIRPLTSVCSCGAP